MLEDEFWRRIYEDVRFTSDMFDALPRYAPGRLYPHPFQCRRSILGGPHAPSNGRISLGRLVHEPYTVAKIPNPNKSSNIHIRKRENRSTT